MTRAGPLAAVLLAAAAVLVWPVPARAVRGARAERRRAAPGRRGWLSALRRNGSGLVGRFASRAVGDDDLVGVVEVVQAVTVQLRAGSSASAALSVVVDHLSDVCPHVEPSWAPHLRTVAATLGLGGDPAPAWRRAASEVGSPALLGVAAAWDLADRTGAPLAGMLEAILDAVRDELRTRAAVAVARAGPQATARLLAWLPLGGLALGQLIGARPIAVLLGTAPGRLCAAAGVGLAVAGRVWTRRLVAAVGR